LTRFGAKVFLFFVVTPPAETVERAWHRGNATGRFKAVDDLLYHNIEAYTGMPQLFFSWLKSQDKEIHFEFLDNSVPKGELPRTIAFGSNAGMTVLDIDAMHNIDRYRAVNVDATRAKDVMNAAENVDLAFLRACLSVVPKVTFLDKPKGLVLAEATGGSLAYAPDLSRISPEIAEWITSIPGAHPMETDAELPDLKAAAALTLGQW
jgi:hypothetical protein